jgi:TetR/AcrR family fatty acid metabolism transcriptional regulator
VAEPRFSAERREPPPKTGAEGASSAAPPRKSGAEEASSATPPRKTGARRDTGDKRERILRAAVKVFAKKGFYASRVSEIAKAAGVADGTIYLYFASKDDVLTSLFEDRMSRLLVAMRTELAPLVDAPSRVRRMIELQLGLLEGQRDLAEVVTVNLRQSSKLLKQYGARRFTEYLDVMASVIADGQRSGELRADVSPRIVARAIFGALDGVAMTWALGNAEPGGLRRAAVQVADVLLAGLMASHAAPPASE